MTPAELYADVRTRVTDLVRDLDPERLETPVPGCPGWTVRDVVAHSAGVATDVIAGEIDKGGSDEWTARQVAVRRGRDVAELIAEWEASSARLEPLLNDVPKGVWRTLLIDLVTHEHDLRGALGVPGGTDSEAYAVARKGFHVGLSKSLDEKGLPGLRLTAADGWAFDAGTAPAAATVTVEDSFELFRALAGRRSRGQVLAFGWDGDPEPYLPVFNHFGDLPELDVVEAR